MSRNNSKRDSTLNKIYKYINIQNDADWEMKIRLRQVETKCSSIKIPDHNNPTHRKRCHFPY